MAKAPISKAHRTAIEGLVESLFGRLKAKLLGPKPESKLRLGGKKLVFGFSPDLTLEALFTAASKEEGVNTPNQDLMGGLLKISEAYLDAHKEKAKAQVVHGVQSFLRDSATKGSGKDAEKQLQAHLSTLLESVTADVRRVIETETTVIRNSGVDDAIQRISALAGVEDPTVLFIVVRDGSRCGECTRLHLREDGVTPKVWKRSQVKAGYHKKGEDQPSVGGLHPHCRCVMSVLMPGFGFDKSGMIVWKGRGWDEYAEQNK
jgi:hypothetical protein